MSFNGIDQWIIKSVKKPSFQVSNSDHSFLNYKFKFPGRVEWQDVNVTLVDPIRPDATATIMKILQANGYEFPNVASQQGSNPLTISKKKAVDALGSVLIKQIDADGQGFVEVWRLENAWISNADFGQLNYDNDQMVEIQLTLKYDWATLNPTDASVNLAPGAGKVSPTFQLPTI
jgi:hypothetical protein